MRNPKYFRGLIVVVNLIYINTVFLNISLLLRGDSLAHGIVGDGPVDGVSAVEVHPLVVLGAVDGNAVLLSGVVRLTLHPVCVGEGLAARVDKGPLSVDVIGTKPVGGQAARHTVSLKSGEDFTYKIFKPWYQNQINSKSKVQSELGLTIKSHVLSSHQVSE